MSRPNTHREALIAELLADVQTLLDRAEALKDALPAAMLEKATSDIPQAVAEFSDKVRDAARDAVGPVTAAAIIAAQTRIAAEIEKTVEETKAEVRQAATAALREGAEADAGRARVLAAATLVGVGIIAVGIGYGAGRFDHASIRKAGEGLAARADGEHWLNLARANPDLGKTLREHCDGGKGAYTVHGARACAVPLWLDAASAPAAGDTSGAPSMVSWIFERSAFFWGVGGLLAGVLIRKFIVESSRLHSVRWLVDL